MQRRYRWRVREHLRIADACHRGHRAPDSRKSCGKVGCHVARLDTGWYGAQSAVVIVRCFLLPEAGDDRVGAPRQAGERPMPYKRLFTKIGLLVSTPVAAMLACSLGGAPARAASPLCGTVPYRSNTGQTTPSPITSSPQVWSFVSEPNLHPMKVTINTYEPGTSSGLIFLAPYAFSDDATYGQPGSLILDNVGNPFWFRPLSSPNLMNTDFRMQHFNGKPVLTFWQGTLATPPAYTNVPAGSSEPGSCYYIIDNTYRVIKTVVAKYGFTSDVHEFLITPANTALLLSTRAIPMNLTAYGGPANGYVQDFAIQEIDLQTDNVLFFWDALKNIPLTVLRAGVERDFFRQHMGCLSSQFRRAHGRSRRYLGVRAQYFDHL